MYWWSPGEVFVEAAEGEVKDLEQEEKSGDVSHGRDVENARAAPIPLCNRPTTYRGDHVKYMLLIYDSADTRDSLAMVLRGAGPLPRRSTC